MFESLEELIAETAVPAPARRTMKEVIVFLEQEISDGAAVEPRRRAMIALRTLLSAHHLTPETVNLSLAEFDRLFPIDGWNPVIMPTVSQSTYLDYRKRARAAIERTLGLAQEKKALRLRVDGWTELQAWLKALPEFQEIGSRKLIPICSTLTMAARRHGLQPSTLTDAELVRLHGVTSVSDERASLRSAAALLSKLQADPARADIWSSIVHPITPIKADNRRSCRLPDHFLLEIDGLVELAGRLRYIRVKEIWEYVAQDTQRNYRDTLRAVASALIAIGRLSPVANSLRPCLQDPAALDSVLRHWLKRVERGEIKQITASRRANVLPCIIERNGYDGAHLRESISQVPEFHDKRADCEMGETAREFCRALIERPAFRDDFLLSHVAPRMAAEAILRRARTERRELTPTEATEVRRLGTVALFCALEVGGAPIRIKNFRTITYGGKGAWLKISDKNTFKVSIPAAYTKNKKPINFKIKASRERYHDTVRWYLRDVRPLFFAQEGDESPYLVPSVTKSGLPLSYGAFMSWFVPVMRDVVGIVCTPHLFRHGQASLLYHARPDLLQTIARRLGDTETTVVRCYAWVHHEIQMERGQDALDSLIGRSAS